MSIKPTHYVPANSALALGSVSGALDLSDLPDGTFAHLTIAGNITGLTLPTDPAPGYLITLVATMGGSGSYTAKLSHTESSFDSVWTPSPTVGHKDRLQLLFDGENWCAVVIGQQMSVPAAWS